MTPAALETMEALSLPQQPDAPLVLTLPEDFAGAFDEALTVFVGTEATYHEGRGAVAGRHRSEGHTVAFTPAFGFGGHAVGRRRYCERRLIR